MYLSLSRSALKLFHLLGVSWQNFPTNMRKDAKKDWIWEAIPLVVASVIDAIRWSAEFNVPLTWHLPRKWHEGLLGPVASYQTSWLLWHGIEEAEERIAPLRAVIMTLPMLEFEALFVFQRPLWLHSRRTSKIDFERITKEFLRHCCRKWSVPASHYSRRFSNRLDPDPLLLPLFLPILHKRWSRPREYCSSGTVERRRLYCDWTTLCCSGRWI